MSTLKLSGLNSGSSIIKAPDSGSTGVTFTLPASAGTLVTSADVTNKLPLAGGTMTGDLVVSADVDITGSLNGTSGALDIKNEANNQNVFIKTTSSGSEVTALKIHSGGVLELPSGGLRVGGTAAANTLDDYEEGTWTVGWTSTSNTFNPSTTTGYYTKVGNLVTISYHAYLSGAPTINASANGFSFTGLPFTSSSGKSSTITWGHKRWMEWPSNTTDVMLDIGAVSTTISTLARTGVGELYNIRAVTFSRNGSGISFAGHYYTDS